MSLEFERILANLHLPLNLIRGLYFPGLLRTTLITHEIPLQKNNPQNGYFTVFYHFELLERFKILRSWGYVIKNIG